MIDRKKVERALEIGERFEECSIDIKRTTNNGRTSTFVSVLVFGRFCHNPLDRALEIVPKLHKFKMSHGHIWAEATVDGINLEITDVDKCKAVSKTIQVPEMVATGKTVEKIITEYVCPEDVK